MKRAVVAAVAALTLAVTANAQVVLIGGRQAVFRGDRARVTFVRDPALWAPADPTCAGPGGAYLEISGSAPRRLPCTNWERAGGMFRYRDAVAKILYGYGRLKVKLEGFTLAPNQPFVTVGLRVAGAPVCGRFTEFRSATPRAVVLKGPTSACATCGNGVVEPGEQCDGTDFGGATCESLYVTPGGVCYGGLGCGADCTYDGAGCICDCTEELGCRLPTGIDCSALWCNREGCPCDHLAHDFDACADQNPATCRRFRDCVDDVGCYFGDSEGTLSFSTGTGVCGEPSNGSCLSETALFSDDFLLRHLCASYAHDGGGEPRCDYCADCDCSNPENLQPYDPDTGLCS